MRGASYCNACGAHNPGGVSSCHICWCNLSNPPRQNPVTSTSYANPKLALFDIDRTILDTSERHRSAVRAGVQPKDFNYKVFTKMSKKDKKKREDFMYREDMLAKDKMIPNSMALIEHLMKEGYTIAYCTGRSFKWYEKTKDQLESKGFPIFQDSTGKALLFLRRNEGQSKGPYKAGVMKTLMAQYDVRFVFDDTPEVLVEGAKLGIPGVYPSIGDYWNKISPRSNPYPKAHMDSKAGGQYVTGTEHVDVAGRAMVDPDDPDGRTIAETMGVDVFTGKPIGKNPAMYSQESLEMAYESIKGTKIQTSPGPMGEMCGGCVYMCMSSGRCKKWSKMKGDDVYVVADWYCGAYKPRAKSNPIKRGKDAKGTYMRWGKSTGKKYYYKAGNKASREKARKKAQAQARAAYAGGYRGNPEHAEDYMVPRDIHKLGKAADSLEGTYSDGMEVPEWWKSKLSVTAKDADTIADSLEYVADNPRRNPAPAAKVSKAKKLYKHMNGKDPAKVKATKIDIGDVWYQVGEGGCWQIGYCSGKETGNSMQKYIHHFNEETKDGNLPNLYATIPDNGKPMLIITGGTWKIKTDEQGVAWIYD